MKQGKLKIDSPCPFSLSRMGKNGNNYFCGSCSKIVIDFREKSEEEIKSCITKDTCGIFNLSQLPGQQRMHFHRKILFYSLTLLSFIGFNVKPMQAQTTETPKVVEENKPELEVCLDDTKGQSVEFKALVPEKKKAIRKKNKKLVRVGGCPSF